MRVFIGNGIAVPRILIIDDEADMRTMLEQMLKPTGCEVIQAPDGEEGVRQHRTAPADLIIIDLYMPKKEGLETIIELRKDFPEVAIVAMSGKTTANAMLAVAQRLGAIGILEKPFQQDQLFQAVEKALGSKSGHV
jgi:DNA-binding NtrC family response regulator